jgi:hypothetical protein
MYGGKDALNDPPSGVVHEVDRWVWKLNGYRVQVSARGYRNIALLRHKPTCRQVWRGLRCYAFPLLPLPWVTGK